MSHYHEILRREIIARSEARNWDDARLEWRLFNIAWVKEGGHCICTHFIKEMCYMRNIVNDQATTVGNCCINQFFARDLVSVFRALRANKINPALLAYADEENVITKWEFNFMMDVWRKRKLTSSQRAKYNEIKNKIYSACEMEAEEI